MGAEDREELVKSGEQEEEIGGPPPGFGGTGKFDVTFEDVRPPPSKSCDFVTTQ